MCVCPFRFRSLFTRPDVLTNATVHANRLRMSAEARAAIQSKVPFAHPPFCVLHAVTGPLLGVDDSNVMNRSKRTAVTFPTGRGVSWPC